MQGINYNAINFNQLENKQIGLGKDVKAGDGKYEDGLTQEEMKELDENGDGVLTENEFRAGCKGNDEVKDKYWDAYAEFCGLKSSQTESGVTKVSQNVKGQKVTTYLDEDENATKQYVKNSDGTRTVTDLKTGTIKEVEKDGSYTKYYKNGTQVSVSVNGTKVKTNADGQITKIVSKTEDGKENVNSFEYNDKGEMTKVTINDQTYVNGENCTITTDENGKTVVKDKDGNRLLVTKKDSEGNTIIYNYENGKKAEAVKVDSDGNALTTVSYENGLKTSKTNCKNSTVRTYERDAEGNLTRSTDTSKDGVKLSEQTYNADNKWATREYYDKDGNVKASITYEYTTDKETGVTTKTAKTYKGDLVEGTLAKTTVTQTDAENKLVEETTYDKDGNMTSKKTPFENPTENFDGFQTINYKNGEVSSIVFTNKDGSVAKKEEYNEKGQNTKTTTYDGDTTTIFEAEFPDETEAKTKMTTIEDGKETVSRTLYGWLKELYPDKTQSEINEIEKLVKSMNANTEFDAGYFDKGSFAKLNLPNSIEKALQEEEKK